MGGRLEFELSRLMAIHAAKAVRRSTRSVEDLEGGGGPITCSPVAAVQLEDSEFGGVFGEDEMGHFIEQAAIGLGATTLDDCVPAGGTPATHARRLSAAQRREARVQRSVMACELEAVPEEEEEGEKEVAAVAGYLRAGPSGHLRAGPSGHLRAGPQPMGTPGSGVHPPKQLVPGGDDVEFISFCDADPVLDVQPGVDDHRGTCEVGPERERCGAERPSDPRPAASWLSRGKAIFATARPVSLVDAVGALDSLGVQASARRPPRPCSSFAHDLGPPCSPDVEIGTMPPKSAQCLAAEATAVEIGTRPLKSAVRPRRVDGPVEEIGTTPRKSSPRPGSGCPNLSVEALRGSPPCTFPAQQAHALCNSLAQQAQLPCSRGAGEAP